MQACHYAASHQSQYVFVHISDRSGRPSPKEDIMEIVLIGIGVTQFFKAVAFDCAAVVVMKVNLFYKKQMSTKLLTVLRLCIVFAHQGSSVKEGWFCLRPTTRSFQLQTLFVC